MIHRLALVCDRPLHEMVVFAAAEASRRGFRGYVLLCDVCGSPIRDHENRHLPLELAWPEWKEWKAKQRVQ